MKADEKLAGALKPSAWAICLIGASVVSRRLAWSIRLRTISSPI
jgi:hypothetical protein